MRFIIRTWDTLHSIISLVPRQISINGDLINWTTNLVKLAQQLAKGSTNSKRFVNTFWTARLRWGQNRSWLISKRATNQLRILITALAGDKFEIWRRGVFLMHASNYPFWYAQTQVNQEMSQSATWMVEQMLMIRLMVILRQRDLVLCKESTRPRTHGHHSMPLKMLRLFI